MIKFENTEVVGFEAAIRGMRNPYNSWDKSDSGICEGGDEGIGCKNCSARGVTCNCHCEYDRSFQIGINDYDLMMRLAAGGSVHAKYRRMIVAYTDIIAPLYWWKEFDTYKVGTVVNSCSTMHMIHAKEFTLDDFSHEHLDVLTIDILNVIIEALNRYRDLYINYNPDDFEMRGVPSRKLLWWQIIQLLPSSYNQRRTVMLNYEVLSNIYASRSNHKLDEWRDFCEWIKELPHSSLITRKQD